MHYFGLSFSPQSVPTTGNFVGTLRFYCLVFPLCHWASCHAYFYYSSLWHVPRGSVVNISKSRRQNILRVPLSTRKSTYSSLFSPIWNSLGATQTSYNIYSTQKYKFPRFMWARWSFVFSNSIWSHTF
jgi:hypothetical protein